MRKGNTGKRFLTAVAIASLSLILAACAGGESGQEPSLESSAAAAEAEESAEIKDEAAAEETDQETQEQAGNPVTIYRGNDTVERMLTEEVRLAEITAENLAGKLIEAGVLEKGVKVNSMELTQKEGMTYIDLDFNPGVPWKTEPNGHIGRVFLYGRRCQYISQSIRCICNKNYRRRTAAESGHNIYSDIFTFTGRIRGRWRESIYSSNRRRRLHHTFFWMRTAALSSSTPSL